MLPRRRAVGGLSLGAYAAFRAALVQYQRGLRDVTKCVNKVATGVGAAERYVALVAGPAYAASMLDAGGATEASVGAPAVFFEDVVFRYDAAAPTPALDVVSLALRPGETTALVGRSGSGKSSLGKLLLRSRDPTSGRVTVDGVDLRRLDVLARAAERSRRLSSRS